MHNFFTALFVQVCLALAIAFGGANALNAQINPAKNADGEPPVKRLSEIVGERGAARGFIMLTPEDLAKYSSKEVYEFLNAANPCDTALPISFNQTINGQLTSADCRLEDGSYANFYYFDGTQGQEVTITMRSTVFDTYLGLSNMDGTFVVEDDDGGGGTDSRIVATLPQTGRYIILANSFGANEFGDYSLNLTGTTPCTFTLSPTGAEAPAGGGTFTFNVNTPAGCQWSASSNDPFITTSNQQVLGPGTVTYTVAANATGAARSGTITVRGQVFTVTQPSLVCTYSINPTSATVPSDETSGSFTITAPAGCPWTAQYNNHFIWTGSSGTGTGTVNYTVRPNNGADRTGTITVAGLTFTITQPGRNCTYSVSPTDVSVNRAEHRGTISVTTQPGCTWTASPGAVSFVTFDITSGIGSGTIAYRIYAHGSYGTRTINAQFYGEGVTTIPVKFTQTGIPVRTRNDFDGDSRADLGFFKSSTGEWMIRNSQTGAIGTTQFGAPGDVFAQGDFDGDRKADISVFRPSNGVWYRINSADNSFYAVQFGMDGDIPIAADIDGDFKADTVVFRPGTGVWYWLKSSDGQFGAAQFGMAEDKPQNGDFDGDGKADLAVFRPSTGVWYILRSSDGGFYGVGFGLSTDIPVASDFDGDGKTDIAVFRPSNGVWYILPSGTGQFYAAQFGSDGDIPVPGDYDRDGRADLAVYRPSTGTWWALNSLDNSPSAISFAVEGGAPFAAAPVR